MERPSDLKEKISRFVFAYEGERTLIELREIVLGERARFPGPEGIGQTLEAVTCELLRPRKPRPGEKQAMPGLGTRYAPFSPELELLILKAEFHGDQITFPGEE